MNDERHYRNLSPYYFAGVFYERESSDGPIVVVENKKYKEIVQGSLSFMKRRTRELRDSFKGTGRGK